MNRKHKGILKTRERGTETGGKESWEARSKELRQTVHENREKRSLEVSLGESGGGKTLQKRWSNGEVRWGWGRRK